MYIGLQVMYRSASDVSVCKWCIGLQVMYRSASDVSVCKWCIHYYCQILINLKCSWLIFEKHTNTNFHKNPSSVSQVVTCRRTDGPSDIMKLIFAILNFANTPKNPSSVPKEDQVSRLYMYLYSAAWSVCAETDSIQMTTVTGTDRLPQSQ